VLTGEQHQLRVASRMRGVRRSSRGESSRKEDRELEQFTISGDAAHLTGARSQPCHRTRAAVHASRRKPLSTFELLSARESGRTGGAGFSSADRAYVGRKHVPAKGPWRVDDMDSEAYVSQFSADGSLLIAGFRVGVLFCCFDDECMKTFLVAYNSLRQICDDDKGSRIRIYDSEKGWKLRKDISCRSLRWTVSDIALSPDQRFLVRILSYRHKRLSLCGVGCYLYQAVSWAFRINLPACFLHRVHWTIFQAYSSLSPIVHIVNVQSAAKESHANITVSSIL
jgi:DDB1- and CUL4-associated factor 11